MTGSSLEMLKVNDLASNFEQFYNLKKVSFKIDDDDLPSIGFSEKLIQHYFQSFLAMMALPPKLESFSFSCTA